MQQEKYSIGWNTFQSNLQETQRELYHEKHFADVTLVSDDMVQIQAHKTVLSSASSVFKQLLLINPSSNPVLYLKGVKSKELESIVQFIYTGEAQVYENRIDFFVDTSKDLDIKGLNEGPPLNSEKDEKKFSSEFDFGLRHESEKKIEGDNVIQLNDSSAKELSAIKNLKSSVCPACDVTFSKSGNMREHYQRNHSEAPPQFTCNKCSKVFNKKGNLDRHALTCSSSQTFH